MKRGPKAFWGISILCACVAGVTGLLGACVGDDPAASSGTNDSGVANDAPAPPGDAGADTATDDAGCKTCGASCVPVNDPAYGCTPTSCDPCPSRPHATTQRCASGACAIDTCDVGYDDLDGDPTNGCETPNPRAFQPDKLSLWLSGESGVTLGADGGVASWQNRSSAPDAGTSAVVVAGRPTVDTTLWPGKPGAKSVHVHTGDSFDVDFSGMMSASGFTMFVVEARFGDGAQCILASHTNPTLPVSCCAQQAQAMQLCYQSNTDVFFEPYCDPLHVAVAANTSSGFQANLSHLTYNPATPRYAFDMNGGTPLDNGATVCPNAGPLQNLQVPGRIGGSYGGPGGYEGLVGEIVLYSTLLSAPDQAAVRAYLKTKWKTP